MEVVGTNSPSHVAKFLVPEVIFGVGVLAEVGHAVRRQGGVNVGSECRLKSLSLS